MTKTLEQAVAEAIRYQLEKSSVRGSKYDNAAQAAIAAVREWDYENVRQQMIKFVSDGGKIIPTTIPATLTNQDAYGNETKIEGVVTLGDVE